MNELTHLSLFTGIGGLDLAAEWAGFETVGQCEFADYPTKVLEKHWPDVERWRDIRTLTKENFYERTGRRTVDVISGGFPCQPFSVAGKQRGKEDDRFLWPEMVRVIKELRPTWVIGENVAGIVRLALDDVLSDLEAEGYATRTFLIPACGVNAPHQRYRTAIVGYSEYNGSLAAEIARSPKETGRRGKEGKKASGEFAGAGKPKSMQDVANASIEGVRRLPIQPGRPRQASSNIVRGSEDVADTSRNGYWRAKDWESNNDEKWNCATQKQSGQTESLGTRSGGKSIPYTVCTDGERRRTSTDKAGRTKSADGYKTGRWWSAEPNVGRVANGISSRVDRLKCLGNAVVPQQFYPIFKAIADISEGIICE